ncbi:SARP family transcriptional regulator [Nocardioides guangzhouensis]|uniref:SARP family transcriptional regulator n=2 Tax=Nocardioides guangzhouensis TaxID=2497878 RepID=A0A4Q4ZFL2_9ACTN|nr:SARP family transcriptional regulator [Nocardioides guangzhouensis]
MLGTFSVTLARAGAGVDEAVDESAWSRRGAAALVKLLALAERRTLHREQVVDALWPTVPVDAALPRLHKAAHYARRALAPTGTPAVAADAVVLRNDLVTLLPGREVRVDAVDFRSRAESALAAGSAEEAAAALALYAGPLLPEDLYEPWAAEWRETLTALHRDLLRLAGRWSDLVRVDPTDEAAWLALAGQHLDRGDTRGAERQLERMEQALARELGTVPSAEARRLKERIGSAAAPPGRRTPGVRLVGRRAAGDAVREHLDRAGAGRGSSLLVTGPAGVGKSAVLDLATTLARQRGWRTGRGAASRMEGAWPYAPVLEALADLSRQHPGLLDGLDDSYRQELDRALSGEQAGWSGETAHQRLFVAAAELVRLAASGHGLLLVVDDLHEADQASLRLLHYLARVAVAEQVVVALGARPGHHLRELEDSLVTRGIGHVLPLAPLDEPAVRRLVAALQPDLDDETVAEIWAVSGGLPFRILEACRTARDGGGVALSGLGGPTLEALRRVALLGSAFTTDELLAVSGLDEDATYAALAAGLDTAVVEPADTGYRFRHALVRDAVLDTFSAHERSRAGREVAETLAARGAPATRVAGLFLASGHPVQAVPHARRAVDTAGALGAYRDGLALIDAVVDHATGTDRAHLLARRGDLLLALADPAAVPAYRAALSVTSGTEHRLVQARLARAATFGGDLDTAAAALAGLELDGDAADGPILLARGNLAYFVGDLTAADAAADAARAVLSPDDPWQIVDLVALQGLLAHQRGEWFERFRQELRQTLDDPSLATAVFDAHLCVAEYLLYGPMDYTEVIRLAEQLRRRAEHHGALRGAAFATSLAGEAALLMGDLDRAEGDLTEAAALHRDVDARAGEAHSLQRLAEVRLARGDRAGARELLRRALPLARWSMVSNHLMQRIHGSLIEVAESPEEAMAAVEQGEMALGDTDRCTFCDVMFEVPAAIASADAGELDAARRHLDAAQVSAARWAGTAWEASVVEAQAHLAAATGERDESSRLSALAEELFTVAGQPLDAARLRAADGLASA